MLTDIKVHSAPSLCPSVDRQLDICVSADVIALLSVFGNICADERALSGRVRLYACAYVLLMNRKCRSTVAMIYECFFSDVGLASSGTSSLMPQETQRMKRRRRRRWRRRWIRILLSHCMTTWNCISRSLEPVCNISLCSVMVV